MLIEWRQTRLALNAFEIRVIRHKSINYSQLPTFSSRNIMLFVLIANKNSVYCAMRARRQKCSSKKKPNHLGRTKDKTLFFEKKL